MIYNWIQLAGFCIQEFVICGIYIYEAIRALKCIVRLRLLVHSPALASPPDSMQQCRPSIDMNLFQTKFSQTNFPGPIVALDVTVPPSTGPVGVSRCDSPSSIIFDYHKTLREITCGGA